MDIVGTVRCRVAAVEGQPASWLGVGALRGLTPASARDRFEVLMRTDRDGADRLVRALIGLAQSGCAVAPLVLVDLVGAGIRRIGRTVVSPDPVGEVVGEFIEVVYTLAVERYRRSLAAALLLTTRRRVGRRRDRERRWDRWMADPTGSSADRWAGDELLELLATVGVPEGEAALLVESRVFDVPVGELAARRGTSPAAVYKARARAEQRLSERVAAAAAA